MQPFITSESLSSDFFSLSWSDPRKNFRAATITWKVEVYIKNTLVQFRRSTSKQEKTAVLTIGHNIAYADTVFNHLL
jgi:hypothetical protein